MRFEKDFVIARSRDEVAADLSDDATFSSLFPDTRVVSLGPGVRETQTPFSALGQARHIRFVFKTRPDGNLRFNKVCDGNVWQLGQVLR